MTDIIHIESISQVHEILGLEKPRHPLVSLIPIDEKVASFDYGDATYVFGFYQLSLKSGISGQVIYGRNSYDFEEGTVLCSKPKQAMSFKDAKMEGGERGWTLLFHPDLIRKSELGRRIDSYSFFSYETHEALHLSSLEKGCLTELADKIVMEYQQNIDRHTQKLIIANIELMLDYCTRYYDRQFYVRTNLNQDIVIKFENILAEYFDSEQTLDLGLPTVKYCGEQLNLSPSYLSDLLKKEVGITAQQYIQDAIIDRAKTRLLGSTEQISQIAYALGFEYPQHFSKLFKGRTGLSPAEFRKVN